MSSGPKPPKAPDPVKTANTQLQYGKDAGVASQGLNMVDQSNPYGSLDYTISGYDPVTGLPQYKANSSYSPQQQLLLNQLQGTKGTVGQAGGSMAQDALSMYSEKPNLVGMTDSLTNQAIDRQLPYMERMMAPAREQLDTQLRNQGILPGTPAYQQQVDKLNDQQMLEKGNFVNSFQGQAFDQSKQAYQLPLQMIANMMGMSGPQDLKTSFGSTPTATVGSPDYQKAVQMQYDAQMEKYKSDVQAQNSMMSGIMGAGGMLLGGPVGGALGSGLGGMMANSGSSFIPSWG